MGVCALGTPQSPLGSSTLFTVSLVCRNSQLRGRRIEIPAGQTTFGRDPAGDLCLVGDSVSRKHGVLICTAEKVWIQDLGSRNGIKVNGNRLEKGLRVAVSHHDKIQIGDWKFRVSIRDQESGEPCETDQAAMRKQNILRELDSLLMEVDGIPCTSWNHETMTDTIAVDEKTMETRSKVARKAAIGASASTPEVKLDTASNAIDNVAKLIVAGDDGTEPDHGSPSSEDASEQNADTTSKFKRIPAHLKPKMPRDSQDAAEQALRRLFGGR